jgi:hypothetical protein
VSESLAQHQGIRGLHAVGHPVDVYVIDAMPIRDLVVPNLAQDADASVVEHVVQALVSFGRRLDKPIYRLELGNIQFGRGRFPTACPDAGRDFMCGFNLHVGKDDCRPPSSQFFTQRAADS